MQAHVQGFVLEVASVFSGHFHKRMTTGFQISGAKDADPFSVLRRLALKVDGLDNRANASKL